MVDFSLQTTILVDFLEKILGANGLSQVMRLRFSPSRMKNT